MTKKSKIPEFKTIQEEAAFWDAHDFLDFEAEFKPAQVHFAKKERPVTVRFDRNSLTQLTQAAREKGMATTTLIRMWVMERLKAAQPG